MKDLEETNQAEKEWMQRDGGPVVRLLVVNRYDAAGNERHLVYRLAVDDPRPLGRKLTGMSESGVRCYESLPFGQWIDMVFEPVIHWEPDRERMEKIIRIAREQACAGDDAGVPGAKKTTIMESAAGFILDLNNQLFVANNILALVEEKLDDECDYLVDHDGDSTWLRGITHTVSLLRKDISKSLAQGGRLQEILNFLLQQQPQ